MRAIVGFARDCGRDLWFILRMTVPLMLLAGFLGAAIATLLPVSLIQSLPMTALTILGIAAIGIFMPVPIAFDVVLAGALLAGGAPIGIVMVFLFTLGIFSVYSLHDYRRIDIISGIGLSYRDHIRTRFRFELSGGELQQMADRSDAETAEYQF